MILDPRDPIKDWHFERKKGKCYFCLKLIALNLLVMEVLRMTELGNILSNGYQRRHRKKIFFRWGGGLGLMKIMQHFYPHFLCLYNLYGYNSQICFLIYKSINLWDIWKRKNSFKLIFSGFTVFCWHHTFIIIVRSLSYEQL